MQRWFASGLLATVFAAIGAGCVHHESHHDSNHIHVRAPFTHVDVDVPKHHHDDEDVDVHVDVDD